MEEDTGFGEDNGSRESAHIISCSSLDWLPLQLPEQFSPTRLLGKAHDIMGVFSFKVKKVIFPLGPFLGPGLELLLTTLHRWW